MPSPEYIFEPEPAEILDDLLPQYVITKIYFALLESAASENAARQRAMAAATDNADELIKVLTRQANRAPGRDHDRDHGDRRRGRGPGLEGVSDG